MIAARGLAFAYTPDTPVFEDLDLSVAPGTITALLGPSGCGKSTLLRVLAGLLEPTRGTVDRLADEPGQRSIALVFQDPRLLPWLTVRQNLCFGMEAAGIPASAWDERIVPLLARVGLAETTDLYPSALSGGMAQRIALIRALCLRPRQLLLDEPFSAVDPLLREDLQAALQQLMADSPHTATLLVTHDIAEALVLGDEVAVLGGGTTGLDLKLAVEAPRPRAVDFRLSPRFAELQYQIREALGSQTRP